MATQNFKNAYALLVGVSEQEDPQIPSLPMVKNDVEALRDLLLNEKFCGFPQGNVQVITGDKATKSVVEEALFKLIENAKQDEKDPSIAFVYFSGHGYVKPGASTHHLIMADTKLRGTNVSGTIDNNFLKESILSDLKANRIFFAFDCCQAGASDLAADNSPILANVTPFNPSVLLPDAKNTVLPDEQISALVGEGKSIPPVGEATKKKTDSKPIPGIEERHVVFKSDGVAVLASSQAAEKSWIREGEPAMSLFTYHLIEALSGYAPSVAGATEVGVLSVMDYMSIVVPQAAVLQGNEQHPTFQVKGDNFPIAKLVGGAGIPAGTALDPVNEAIAVSQTIKDSFNQSNDKFINEITAGGHVVNIQKVGGDVNSDFNFGTTNVDNSQKTESHNTVNNINITSGFNSLKEDLREDPQIPEEVKAGVTTTIDKIEQAALEPEKADAIEVAGWLSKVKDHLKEHGPGYLKRIAGIIKNPANVVAEALEMVADGLED